MNLRLNSALLFNANKLKCTFFRTQKSYKYTGVGTPNLSIDGINIEYEFVEKWPHLGHRISLNLSDCDDADISHHSPQAICYSSDQYCLMSASAAS